MEFTFIEMVFRIDYFLRLPPLHILSHSHRLGTKSERRIKWQRRSTAKKQINTASLV
jgi:hypothetical protein